MDRFHAIHQRSFKGELRLRFFTRIMSVSVLVLVLVLVLPVVLVDQWWYEIRFGSCKVGSEPKATPLYSVSDHVPLNGVHRSNSSLPGVESLEHRHWSCCMFNESKFRNLSGCP